MTATTYAGNGWRDSLKIVMDWAISRQATGRPVEGSTHRLYSLFEVCEDVMDYSEAIEGIETMKAQERTAEKQCNRCNEVKPVTEFSPSRRIRKGEVVIYLASVCKPCQAIRAKESRARNPDTMRKYNQEYKAKNREANRKRKQAWDARNRAHIAAYNKRKYDANPQAARERARNNRLKNPQAHRERVKDWRDRNRARVNAIKAKRRAVQVNATVAWSNVDKIVQLYMDAQLMTKLTGIEYQVDHIIPLQGGLVCGLHCEDNLQVIPAWENFEKHNCFSDDIC